MEIDENKNPQKSEDQDSAMPWKKCYPTREEVIADMARRRSQTVAETTKENERTKTP